MSFINSILNVFVGSKSKKDLKEVEGIVKEILSYEKEFSNLKNCSYKNNIQNNCKYADLVILLTEWDEFTTIDFKKIVNKGKKAVEEVSKACRDKDGNWVVIETL